MRKQITRVGVIASRSANRIYDEKLRPFADDIKQQEAKEVFASTIIAANKRLCYTYSKADHRRQSPSMVKGRGILESLKRRF